MTTELQSNILSANTVKKAMPACAVHALVQSMTFVVDTIIAGHFLNTESVAAIALGVPIIGLMLSFTGMILQGSFLKLINAMGRNDMDDYQRIYSVALSFTILVDCIFLAICLFGTDGVMTVAGARAASASVVDLGRLYIRTACLEILFFCVGTLHQIILASYGYQNDRMICSVSCVVVNIVSSVVMVNILPKEIAIAGLGIGSALGTLVQMIISFVMMHKRSIRIKFRFYPLNRKNIVDSLDMIRRGFPSSIDNILGSVSNSVVNRLVLAIFAGDTAVLALVTIINTFYSLVKTTGRAAFFASEPLIGILFGAKDHEGIKKTFITAFKCGLLCAVGAAILLLLLRTPLLTFYKVNGNKDAEIGFILISMSGILSVIVFTVNAVYEATGHILLSLIIAVLPDSILYPLLVPVLCRSLGVTGIWLAMGYNFIPFFIVFYGIFALRNKTPRVPLGKLLALKEDQNRVTELDVSIPVNAKDVTFVSERLQRFLKENGVAPKIAYKAALCTEEIAADYLTHRAETESQKKTAHKAYMDIKAFREDHQIEIIIRNYDEPYNPLIFDNETDKISKIGITMAQKISKRILHSYAYHLNIVSFVIEA